MVIFDFLNTMGAGAWFLLAVVVLAVELLLTSTYLLWIGLAALVVSLLHLPLDLPAAADWPLFALLSLVGAFIGVRFYGPRARAIDDRETVNQGYEYLVGRLTVLAEGAVNGRGPIELSGTRFMATLDDALSAPPGTQVVVSAVSGAEITVKLRA